MAQQKRIRDLTTAGSGSLGAARQSTKAAGFPMCFATGAVRTGMDSPQ